jgi:glycerophosphoryl diester phosphodiesterase
MTPSLSLRADALPALRRLLRPLLAYEIIWKLLTIWLLGPLSVALMHALIGLTHEPAVTNTKLLTFALSPVGVTTAVVYGIVTLTLTYLEQAGLCLLFLRALRGLPVTSREALRRALRHLPALLRVTSLQVGILLLSAVPFLVLAALTYWLLLSSSDINYYLAARPPAFLAAAGIGAALVLTAAAWLAFLLVRWILTVPVCLFEGLGGQAALRRSAALVRGRRWLVLGVFVAWQAGKALVYGLLLAGLLTLDAAVLTALGDHLRSVLWAAAGLMLVKTVVFAAVSFVDTAGIGLVVTLLYENGYRRRGDELPARLLQERDALPVARWRERLYGLAAVMVGVITVGQAVLVIREFTTRKPVAVTAHRAGAGTRVPENSLSALRGAIADGAEFAEIDVQLSADGVVMVLHDQDVRRLTGVAKRLRDMTRAEIQALDMGGRVGPQFQGERIATLEEFIDAARGKIKLNIELKYYGHDPRLADRVVRLLHDKDFAGQVVITSLEYRGLAEVRRLDPRIQVGYIVTASVGDLTRLDLDFLSLNQRQVTPELMRRVRAHGLGVHAWTVNKRTDMVRMIHRGVDNLITDDAALAVEVVEWYEGLSDVELVLLRFRQWLGS